ncbi:DUF6760 family protein [Amycolatopsis minnesotensis]|uniref:DUF6760 domain-containing protein n=1 Tax=Amycolatopsis minnesotensis TaxID=337894 RepID=A0ABP5BQ56_9PSEU
MTYATDRLYQEVAYVAYHFHWSRDEVLDLEHRERIRWVEQIAGINTRINEGG